MGRASKSSKPAAAPAKKKKKKAASPVPLPPSPPPSKHLAHHIRPPPISSGNPSIHILLNDDDARARYQGFREKSFVPIYRMTDAFLDSVHIPKLHELLSMQPMTHFLLNNNDHVFPGMVGQFFANLRFESKSSRHVIVSQVNRVSIKLDYHLLNTIYGTTLADPTSTLLYWDDTHLWPQTSPKFNLPELRTMFKVKSREAKEFNPSYLAPVDRVIYHILVNFVNPVAGHFTSPGKVPLVYYFLFTHRTPIDWGFVVFKRLSDTITDHRRNLPHAPFLTPIFKHFHVPINELGISPPTFDLGAITKKGIRLHQGKWITRAEYLSISTASTLPSSQPSASATDPPASTSLLASVQLLQTSVNMLFNHVRYLEHGVKMALPTSDLQEEFESDKLLFDIPSDDSDAAAGHGPTTSDAVASESADSAEGTSASDDSAETTSASSSSADEPLVRSFKRSKPAP